MPRCVWTYLACLTVLTSGLIGCGVEPSPETCLSAKELYPAERTSDELARGATSTPYQATGNPFEPTLLDVRYLRVTPCGDGCPIPMDVYAPADPGTYAVIQFQHGYMVDVRYYSEFFRHLASQGFVVVAPQMYPPGGIPGVQPTIREEAAALLAVADWVSTSLDKATDIQTHPTARGLVGHSRGGKVSWLAASQAPDRFRALAGVDPMDGTIGGWTQVITGPFTFDLPSLAIGAGLGSRPALVPGLTCAPEGQNHVQFYAASPSPAWHVVIPDGGHADMLDDDVTGCGIACSYCPSGPNPPGMRQVTAGLLAAFFRYTLQEDATAIQYLTDPSAAPMPFTVEQK